MRGGGFEMEIFYHFFHFRSFPRFLSSAAAGVGKRNIFNVEKWFFHSIKIAARFILLLFFPGGWILT